jgi:hypothetical protein
MIWGKFGDWYGVDYTIGSNSQVWSYEFHTLKHHDVEQQIKDEIGRTFGHNPDSVKVIHAVRMVKA